MSLCMCQESEREQSCPGPGVCHCSCRPYCWAAGRNGSCRRKDVGHLGTRAGNNPADSSFPEQLMLWGLVHIRPAVSPFIPWPLSIVIQVISLIRICSAFFLFLNFTFPFAFHRLRPKATFLCCNVLIKNIMKMMRPGRLPNPATYWAGNVGKFLISAHPNHLTCPLGGRSRTCSLVTALPCPQWMSQLKQQWKCKELRWNLGAGFPGEVLLRVDLRVIVQVSNGENSWRRRRELEITSSRERRAKEEMGLFLLNHFPLLLQ